MVENRLDEEQTAALLLFWSGSSSPPPFGFAPGPGPVDVDEQWTLARHTTGSSARPRERARDESRLPEASTCDRCAPRARARLSLVTRVTPRLSRRARSFSSGARAKQRRLSLPEYPNADVLFSRLTTALTFGGVGYDKV